MEETYVCNLIKEDVCFVSTSFDEEMALSRQKDPSVLCKIYNYIKDINCTATLFIINHDIDMKRFQLCLYIKSSS